MSGPRADITKTLLQVPGVWSPGKSVYEYRGPHWTLSQVRAIVGELFPRMNDVIDNASNLQLEQQDNSALAEVSPEEVIALTKQMSSNKAPVGGLLQQGVPRAGFEFWDRLDTLRELHMSRPCQQLTQFFGHF
ncbi:hypothetical protein ACLKA6_006734 [Drosophila palustris]